MSHGGMKPVVRYGLTCTAIIIKLPGYSFSRRTLLPVSRSLSWARRVRKLPSIADLDLHNGARVPKRAENLYIKLFGKSRLANTKIVTSPYSSSGVQVKRSILSDQRQLYEKMIV